MSSATHKLRMFPVYVWLTLAVFTTFVAVMVTYVTHEQRLHRLDLERHELFVLAAQLRQSSDQLSRLARAYVTTADPLYRQQHQQVLDIRDGRAPRPIDYFYVDYWGDSPVGMPSRTGPVSLLALLQQAHFTARELALLAGAKAASDQLAQTERSAMALVANAHPPTPAVRDRALDMLYGKAYLKAKIGVMRSIEQVQRMEDLRTLIAIQRTTRHVQWLRALLFTIGALLIYLIWGMQRTLRGVLGGTLTKLYARIERLGHGDFSTEPLSIQEPADNVMGWLTVTGRQLADMQAEQLHTQAALVDQEQHLATLIATSPVGVFETDTKGECTFVNPRWVEITGLSADQAHGDGWISSLHPEDRDEVLARWVSAASAGSSLALEYRYQRADGSVTWVLGQTSPIQSRSGELLGHIGTITDITERKQAEIALQQSQQRLLHVQHVARMGFLDWNLDTNDIWLSSEICLLYGLGDKAVMKTPELIAQVVHPDDQEQARILLDLAIRGLQRYDFQHRVIRPDGSVLWVHSQAEVSCDADGRPRFMLGTSIDITERKRADDQLKLAASVFTHAREGIMITDAEGTIFDVNDMLCRISGYARGELLGNNPRMLGLGLEDRAFQAEMWQHLADEGFWSGEVWNRYKDGEPYACLQAVSAIRDRDGKVTQYVALLTDITELKRHQQQLEHIAHYDLLTGLPNRVLLGDRLKRAMTLADRHGQRLAIAYLDLDGFKAINDRHGHHAGDQFLVDMSRRLTLALREPDTLARLGGDEFVAILSDVQDDDACFAVIERLLATATDAIALEQGPVRISASIGLTFYPQPDPVDSDQLIRQADHAMYEAKQTGRNRFHAFDPERDRNIRGQHENLAHIRKALSCNEFVLHYQPKVNMRTGQILGVEALIRWQHPQRGLLPPADFLSLVQDHPLGIELGNWVIASALDQLDRWRAEGLNLTVSVNVDAQQLQQAEFTEHLFATLAQHPGVRPGELQMEVLETSALEDLLRVSRVIDACREFGVTFALDDFGTGYSSLTYLKRLPVTLLKIDRSFVHDMLDSPDDRAILEAVIRLASAFRRQILAEGVETLQQGELLIQMGCELAQGYVIAHPMPAEALGEWVASWQPDPSWRQLPVPRQVHELH